MKTTGISSLSITDALRQSILRAQLELIKAQKEAATGRLADPGLTLGGGMSQSVALRQQFDRLSAIGDTNGLVASRLDATQASLKSISDLSQSFLNAMIGARNAPGGQDIALSEARADLKTMIASLNAASGGEFLFAGVNTDATPIADYFASPPTAGKSAVDAAFFAKFGITQSDAGVSDIGSADMKDFLDTSFEALFDHDQWASTWSSASDRPINSRIELKHTIDTSVSANAEPFRKLAMAITMVADLGVGKLNQGAFEAVIDKAVSLAGEAMQGIGMAQADMGVAQKSVTDAKDRIALQLNMISGSINKREAVDPYEAATRVNSIMTQLEISYDLTGRISKLSILNYL
jgi:flagellar hook-associated protein 3 FlgL